MYIKKPNLTAIFVAVALIAIIGAVACSSSDPETIDVSVSIKSGLMEPKTIKVKQGDMVTLKISADEGGEFHLHTYDIEANIPADEETDFYFVADATGRFRITYNHRHQNGSQARTGS